MPTGTVSLFGTTSEVVDVRSSTLTKEISGISAEASTDFLNDDFDQTNTLPDEASFSAGQIIVKLISLALEDLQKFMDFDQCRLGRAKNIDTEVDWDDPLCQEAVLKLVMVIEAAILQ